MKHIITSIVLAAALLAFTPTTNAHAAPATQAQIDVTLTEFAYLMIGAEKIVG